MKKSKKTKVEENDVKFDSKSLVDENQPSFTTDVEDNDKVQKEFKKQMDKVHKFEAFIDIHIDNIENLEIEAEVDDKEEFDAEYEEDEGCGCCDDCNGQPDCECGCEDCECTTDDENILKASDFVSAILSEGMKWHLDNQKPITENIFRPGSEAFYGVLKEARELFDLGKVNLCDIDRELYESTDIGRFAYFNGELVPLDLPMENIIELNEAKYKGKKVKLNYPMRSSGPKKYKVYVKNPKTGKVRLLHFGDVKGGLSAKISDPEARKSFSARHKCHLKKDKTKAGYFACRLTKYGHLFGGKTYPGYW